MTETFQTVLIYLAIFGAFSLTGTICVLALALWRQ